MCSSIRVARRRHQAFFSSSNALSPAPALNFATVLTLILIGSRVFGWKPLRVLRFTVESVPRPVTCTLRPRLISLPMVTNSESTMRATYARGSGSCCEEIASMNSFLFTACLRQSVAGAGECNGADGAEDRRRLGRANGCTPRTNRHGPAARDERGAQRRAGESAYVLTAARRGGAGFRYHRHSAFAPPAFSCGTRPTHAHKEDTDGPSQAAAREG